MARDKEKRRLYNKAYRAAVMSERGERYLNMRKSSGMWKERAYAEGGLLLDQFRETRAALASAWRRRNPHQRLILDARARAKRRGLLCTITVENVKWPTHCPVFGVELLYGTGVTRGEERNRVATLDRRVPDLGYTSENTTVISHRANRLKSDHSVDTLRRLLAYLTNN